MKKEALGSDDPQSLDNRRLSVIARNPNHPMHTHAKAELDRRKMKNEGAMKRIATTQSNKADRVASGGKKGLETFKKREMQKEAKGAPKMTGDSIAIQRAKDAELNKALGRTKTGRKKPERTMTSTQKSLASMQKETKGAPKGYHFTRDGKLRKGDAGADGDGGAKLRSDPLDKQRSKIPPLPEAYNEPQGQAKRMMSPLQKARMDKEKADRDRDGKLMNVKTKTKTEATMKRLMGEEVELDEDRRTELRHQSMMFTHAMKQAEFKKKDPRLAKQHDMAGKLHAKAADMHVDNHPDAKKHSDKANKASKLLGEEVELVNEISKKTAQSYLDKTKGDDAFSGTRKANNRLKGAIHAVGIKRKKESVNELDKKTLGSYIKKAGPDAVKQTAQAKRHSDAGDMADKDRDMYKHYAKSQRAMDKAKNRQKGIGKAVDKLTKEDTMRVAKVSEADRENIMKISKMLEK